MSDFIHVDMDAFFASVEQHDHPELQGKPVIIGSPPDRRGVVSTCSYEARAYGVHSAMPSREAFEKCPQGIFIRPNMARYQAVSHAVFEIFKSFTPLVEPLSIDEAFLDVSHVQRLFGDPVTIAKKIKERILSELGITASAGIATTKFLAKLASEEKKPNGLFQVPIDAQKRYQWLGNKKISALWGIGPVLNKQLNDLGFFYVKELQCVSLEQLQQQLSPTLAHHLYHLAFGRDERPIVVARDEQSFSRECTYPEDTTDLTHLQTSLMELVEDVGKRLRLAEYWAKTFRIKIRYTGFQTVTRQLTPGQAICDDFGLKAIARHLLNQHLEQDRPVRLIGFCADNLTQTPEPHDLFAQATSRKRFEEISKTTDALRLKFGENAIHLGPNNTTKNK